MEKLQRKSAFALISGGKPKAPPIKIMTFLLLMKAFCNKIEYSSDDIFLPRSSQIMTWSRPLNGQEVSSFLISFSSSMNSHTRL